MKNIQRIMYVKLSVIGVVLLAAVVSTACSRAALPEPSPAAGNKQAVEICVDEETGTQMTYAAAVTLAEAGQCIERGSLLETHMCNRMTGTWWLDLDIDQPGCAPACVVDIVDKTVEVNWRCTGALPKDTSTEPPPPADTSTEPSADTQDTAAEPSEEPAAEWPADWSKYASLDDGFMFRYPPTWTIELLTDRPAGSDGTPAARAVLLTQDSLQLLIEFRSFDEAVAMGPGSLPAGTVEEQGSVALFGRTLPKHVLVEGEKDRAIFVGDRYPGLEIYIQLTAAAESDIPEAANTEFDQILASFTSTGTQTEQDAYPGWATYTGAEVAPGVGFTFRYRSDWTLTEIQAGTETPTGPSAATAVLQRDAYLLRVQYKNAADEATMVAAEFPESVLMEAGTAWFMDRQVPRLVVVDGERLTHIFVTYTDDTLLITVDLSQDPAIVAEDDLDLSVGIRNEMDEILASFKLATPED